MARKTTLPTTLCASDSLRLLAANPGRELRRGPRRDILKGPGLRASVAMADTATTASAAAASAASAATDAPPFQLGKPRFQQVRTGLRPEGQRVAPGWSAEPSPKPPLAPGSRTRGYPGACSDWPGTSAKATPFLLVSGASEDPQFGSPLATVAVALRLLASAFPAPAETLCDWPLRPGMWASGPAAAAAAQGSPCARQLPTLGGKFESGLEEKLPWPRCPLPVPPGGD